jgi:hypothetical protein
MSLLANLRKKQSERFATATLATFATHEGGRALTVATVATVSVAKPINTKPSTPEKVGAGDTAQPINPEAWEERAAICEFDGGLSRADAESMAWQEDDRQRCTQCQNYRREVCTIAKPGGVVSANRGYQPWQGLPRRCAGYCGVSKREGSSS